MKKRFALVLCAVFTACNTPTSENQIEKLVRQMFGALFSKGDKVAVEFVYNGSAQGEKFKLPISTVHTIVNG